MRRHGTDSATAARDDGLRKVTRLTWRAGAAGVAYSALMAAAFRHGAANQHATGTQRTAQQGSGTILIPAQPPAPAAGSAS